MKVESFKIGFEWGESQKLGLGCEDSAFKQLIGGHDSRSQMSFWQQMGRRATTDRGRLTAGRGFTWQQQIAASLGSSRSRLHLATTYRGFTWQLSTADRSLTVL